MRTAAALFAASMLAACVAEPTESGDSQDVVSRNMLSANMLSANMLSANMLSANMLSANMLSANQLQLNPSGAQLLLSTADGRFLLQYIVSCAVPTGIDMIADVPDAPDSAPPATPYTCSGGTCTFTGQLGLAPTWLHHKLDHNGVGWVSSCLLARVNANLVSEEISLRGGASQLAVGPAEAQLYTVEEGAFYGDVFNYPKPIVWIACEGKGQIDGTFGGLVERKCARPDPNNPGKTICGFTYAGYCGDYSPQVPAAHACADYTAAPGYYNRCRASSGHGTVVDDIRADGEIHHTFDHVITTYVTP
jgi:hypothetical protein